MRPLSEIVRERARRALSRNRSYAQAGEDRIASHVLRSMRVENPSYLDLGAHHPTWLSNTYLFYIRGCRGVCVEADPELLKRIRRRRFRDTCLNAAIAPEDGSVPFHVMDATTLSTISEVSVEGYRQIGRRVLRTLEVPALSPATVLDRHSRGLPTSCRSTWRVRTSRSSGPGTSSASGRRYSSSSPSTTRRTLGDQAAGDLEFDGGGRVLRLRRRLRQHRVRRS